MKTLLPQTELYGQKIKKNPKLSPVYHIDRKRLKTSGQDSIDILKWNWRNRAFLEVFSGGIIILIAGILFQQWFIVEITAVFLAMGIVSGLVAGISPSEIAGNFVTGAKDMMNVAFIISCGRAPFSSLPRTGYRGENGPDGFSP